MIRQFDEWTAPLAEVTSLNDLRGAVVGIEATDYLNRLSQSTFPDIKRPVKESLVPAMGPTPFGLKAVLRATISIWRAHEITPLFVFSGLDVGKPDNPFAASEAAAKLNEHAWGLYHNGNAESSVQAFEKSNAVPAEALFRNLQAVLREEGVDFMVAPYGAWAQLAYLYRQKVIDTIASSSEVLLYDVPETITHWDFMNNEFVWVKRHACIKDIGAISPDVFIDACLLSGSQLLPAFPLLETHRKQTKVKAALDMIMQSMGRTGHSVCLHYQDDPNCQRLNYLDRFRKARLSIKHHVVLTTDGKVEPFEVDRAPGDIHEFIGQRLPEELYFYLSKGIIGPKVLNWRTSGEITEFPPLDNGDSVEYHDLVRDQLIEVRTSAISLLSNSLHRFYAHKDLNLRCWFDKSNVKVISMRDLENPIPIVKEWNVHEHDGYGLEKNKYRGDSSLLGIAVKSLKNPNFAKASVTKKVPDNLLETKEEILFNSVWRLLHLRGYVNKDHTLTPWGNVLYTTLAALPKNKDNNVDTVVELEEAAVVAVELLRLGLLNSRNMHPAYSGAPYRGSEASRQNQLLISRLACLAKLNHAEIGYTGPLSRNLLGYFSMTSAVRSSLRDLAEVCLASLLLAGDATRDRTDYPDLGLDLPFLLHGSCGLGLAVSSYLDLADASAVDGHLSPERREVLRTIDPAQSIPERGTAFNEATDYAGDLDKAFALWDAVYAGIGVAGELVEEKKVFDEADVWLKGLR